MKKVILLILMVLAGSTSLLFSDDAAKNSVRMKPALLVIDVQNAYLPIMDELGRDEAMSRVNDVIKMFRQHGFPIIRVYHTDPERGPVPGTEAFDFPASVQVTDTDPKIVKNFGSAFKKTELEKLLREKGCNTVLCCGLSAVGCVLATYFGASDRDFAVAMVKEALLSHNAQYTKVIEDICSSVSLNKLEALLKNAEK